MLHLQRCINVTFTDTTNSFALRAADFFLGGEEGCGRSSATVERIRHGVTHSCHGDRRGSYHFCTCLTFSDPINCFYAMGTWKKFGETQLCDVGPQRTRIFVTSVLLLAKIDKKCDRDSAQKQTDKQTDTRVNRQTEFIICPMPYGIAMGQTSSSAAAERPREPLSQLKSCQLLHNCTKNHIWLEGLPFHVV